MSEAESGDSSAPARWRRALIRGDDSIRNGIARLDHGERTHPRLRARLSRPRWVVDVLGSNRAVAERSDVLILAVKPQGMAGVLDELRARHHGRSSDPLGAAAGVSLGTLSRGLGPGHRIARAMPNTPALVGEGAAAYCLGPEARPEDAATVAACLGAGGSSLSRARIAARRRDGPFGERAGVCLRHHRGPWPTAGSAPDLPREIALALAASNGPGLSPIGPGDRACIRAS